MSSYLAPVLSQQQRISVLVHLQPYLSPIRATIYWLTSDLYALSFIHGILFLWQIHYTDGDVKEAERDMYAGFSYFRGFYDQDGYEKWENHLEDFFRYFFLTLAHKCHYAQMKIAREAYWW